MSEVITKMKNKFSLRFELTQPRLLRLRKYFMLFSSLLIVAGVVETYLRGFSISVCVDLVLASMLLNYSTKCETLILRLRLEKELDNQLAKKEVI